MALLLPERAGATQHSTPSPRAWGLTDLRGVAGIGDRSSCNLLADAIDTAQVDTVADAGYQGAGPSVRVR
jgi:hypothetical protein